MVLTFSFLENSSSCPILWLGYILTCDVQIKEKNSLQFGYPFAIVHINNNSIFKGQDFLATRHSYSTKNIFSLLSPWKEEICFVYKGIALMWIEQSLKTSVLRKYSVLYLSCHVESCYWLLRVRSGTWMIFLLIHDSAYIKSICFEQFHPYQHKCFKMCFVNYIWYFNWLSQTICKGRKAIIPQSCHCLRPKLQWFS